MTTEHAASGTARLKALATRGALLLALALVVAPGRVRADDVATGDAALKAGRLEDAMKAYDKAAASGKAAGQAGVGRVWLRRGRNTMAMEAFRRAQRMDPNLAAAWYGQGEVLRRQEKCAEAVPLFEKATQIDRRYPEAQLALGTCLVAAGQFERGIAALEKGLRWGKEWEPRFLVARGAAWMSRDSLRAAGVDFTRARELAPKDHEIRRAVGDYYLQRGTWALAIPELEAAIALDSTDYDAQFSLARALFFEGRYDQALATYQRVTAQSPDYAPGQLGLGDLLYRAGAADPRRYLEARGPLQRYVELEPEDPKGWSLLGRTLYRMGQRDSALDLMLKAEALGDRNKELYTALGLVYADRKEWDKALAALERGEPGPREQPIVAQIYEFTGQPEKADSIYIAVLARDSTSTAAAFAYEQRARLRYRQKDYAAAVDLFGRALALNPQNGESWFYQGLSFKELGRPAEALEGLRRAAALDTGVAERHFWHGVLADETKNRDEAERAFQRAVELEPSGLLASKAYRQLGFYRLLDKRWSAAIPLLRRAVELDEKDAQAWLWLAQGTQNAGDRKRAAEYYRRVLALDPGNAEARKGLKILGVAAR